MADLMEEAADYLENGGDPFGSSFLCDHGVTADECMTMADQLAAGARIMAWVQRNPLKAAKFAETGSAGMALDAITQALARSR